MGSKIIEEEKSNLNKIINVINNEINICNNTIEKFKKYNGGFDINSYSKVDINQNKDAIEEKKKLCSIKKNPYIGRLKLLYKHEKAETSVYVGMKDLIVDNEAYIISWAAPISRLYNNFDIGPFSIANEKGDKIEGKLQEKRIITIKNGQVVDVKSIGGINEKEIEEKYMKEKIGNSKTDKLGSIVETIQKEQNNIIRLPIEKSILVQGCAGSGKSSVAFHRVAYIIYNGKLSPEDVLVITPNKIFQEYTKDLLLEIGSDFDVPQYTFNEFAHSLLGDDYKHFQNSSSKEEIELNTIKTGKGFKKCIDKFIDYLDSEFISNEDIIIDNFKVIDSQEIKSIWLNEFKGYKVNAKIDRFKEYLKAKLTEKSERYLRQKKAMYDNNINTLEKVLTNRIQINEIKRLNETEKENSEKRLKKTFTAIINKYINSIKPIDFLEAYNDLLREEDIINRLYHGCLNEKEKEQLLNNNWRVEYTYVDLIPALYLYIRLNDINRYRHVMVDECQDLSYIEVEIIDNLAQSFTLVGDFNQSIIVDKNTVQVDEVVKLFSKYTFFNTHYLNKSFRNSKNITEFANSILAPYFKNKSYVPEAFNRETTKPTVMCCNNDDNRIRSIVSRIKNNYSEDKNIAIIVKDDEKSMDLYNKLHNELPTLNRIGYGDEIYKIGINVLSVPMSKGLEFDYVLIADGESYEDNEEDRRLLYIAATRALNRLDIFTIRANGLLESLDKRLWLKETIKDNSMVVISLQNTIKDYLLTNFEPIYNELEFYINDINDISKLMEVLDKIMKIDDYEEMKRYITNAY